MGKHAPTLDDVEQGRAKLQHRFIGSSYVWFDGLPRRIRGLAVIELRYVWRDSSAAERGAEEIRQSNP